MVADATDSEKNQKRWAAEFEEKPALTLSCRGGSGWWAMKKSRQRQRQGGKGNRKRKNWNRKCGVWMTWPRRRGRGGRVLTRWTRHGRKKEARNEVVGGGKVGGRFAEYGASTTVLWLLYGPVLYGKVVSLPSCRQILGGWSL